MIAALLLAVLGTAASPKPPDDVDRFIAICVDGGKRLLDQSGRVVDRKDVPETLLGLFGSPGERGRSTFQYYTVGQGDDEAIVTFEQLHHVSAVVQSVCTLVSANFGPVSGRQALLQKLRDRGVEDVTSERFIVGDVNANGHERAYQNPIVQNKLSNHQPIYEATLQTVDPNYEIFVRPIAAGKLYAMSVFNLSEKDSREARRAWEKCRKADCSLPH